MSSKDINESFHLSSPFPDSWDTHKPWVRQSAFLLLQLSWFCDWSRQSQKLMLRYWLTDFTPHASYDNGAWAGLKGTVSEEILILPLNKVPSWPGLQQVVPMYFPWQWPSVLKNSHEGSGNKKKGGERSTSTNTEQYSAVLIHRGWGSGRQRFVFLYLPQQQGFCLHSRHQGLCACHYHTSQPHPPSENNLFFASRRSRCICQPEE